MSSNSLHNLEYWLLLSWRELGKAITDYKKIECAYLYFQDYLPALKLKIKKVSTFLVKFLLFILRDITLGPKGSILILLLSERIIKETFWFN